MKHIRETIVLMPRLRDRVRLIILLLLRKRIVLERPGFGAKLIEVEA